MDKIKVKINGEFIPRYQSEYAAGCDLCACIKKDIVINPNGFCTIPTGIKIEMPVGYEAQVRPRSGLAKDFGIGILNAPGTIDADYRGEIMVILFNFGKEPFRIRRGNRIAQLVFNRAQRAEFIRIKELNNTERQDGGFGHTKE